MVDKELTPDEQEALKRLVAGEEPPNIEERELQRDIAKVAEFVAKTEGELPTAEDDELVELRRSIEQLQDQMALTEALLRRKDEPEELRQLLPEKLKWVKAIGNWQQSPGNEMPYFVQCYSCANFLGHACDTAEIRVELPVPTSWSYPGGAHKAEPNVRTGDIFACIETRVKEGVWAGTIRYVGINHFLDAPRGTIRIWYGAANKIPPGWYVCNGENNTPNLINNFIRGCEASSPPYAGGGGVGTHTHDLDYPASENVMAGEDLKMPLSTTKSGAGQYPPHLCVVFIQRID